MNIFIFIRISILEIQVISNKGAKDYLEGLWTWILAQPQVEGEDTSDNMDSRRVSEGYAPHSIYIIIRWQVVVVLTSQRSIVFMSLTKQFHLLVTQNDNNVVM
jgi:hypothetical protein